MRLPFGFVDAQGASSQVAAAQRHARFIRLTCLGHFHKRKTSWLSRVAIRDDVDAFDGAVRFEQGTNRLFRRSKIQVAYKDVLQRVVSLPRLHLKAGKGAEASSA